MSPKAFYVCCAFLLSCLALSEADHETSAASLSKAPVGLYSRRNIYGDDESAASLGGTPVGLYNKRQLPQLPYALPLLRYPLFYPQAVKLPFYGVPQYGRPYKAPNVGGAYRPKVPGKPGVRPGVRPGVQPRLLGGLLGGAGGLLGGFF